MDPQVRKRIQLWLQEPFDAQTRAEVKRQLDTNPDALVDAFYRDLSFGTGGMRALMGVGTNRLNVYTIRAATAGLCTYLKRLKGSCSVFIGYDVRHHSREFAENTARVVAGAGMRAFITSEICPTPLVSYGCRHFGCSAAVMITASHNPPAYNGYKVYWQDGGQVTPPHDQGIIDAVQTHQGEIPLAPLDSPNIRWVGKELDEAYLRELKKLQRHPEIANAALRILYTPLHGTGIRIVPQALKSWGYPNVHLVEAQSTPDGAFPNAPSPNPEDEKALRLGTEELVRTGGDLLIATDPDADRMGVVVMHEGKPVRLSGNQIACVCLEHICAQRRLSPGSAFLKTIVTTELFRKIAEHFGGTCIDVLTGFKYIAEQIARWEKHPEGKQFIFGAEESYGYLLGTMVRDKDAVSAACLIAEVAAAAKRHELTLIGLLHQIYAQYGVHRESLSQIVFPDSASGMEQMQALMQRLRSRPPGAIANVRIKKIEDYLAGTEPLPPSDVLRFWLDDGTKLVIRPSGTEPKIKIYAEVLGSGRGSVETQVAHCDERLTHLTTAFRAEITKF